MAAKKRILILHSGGTLGMDLFGTPQDGAIFLASLKKHVPNMFEIADVEVEILFNKDSSNIEPSDWVALARRIDSLLPKWDAFVVTHGTDTMAFSASCLSFMLLNPSKPIIFTGSQRPLSDVRSDGPRNLLNAVELAASGNIKEVCIFFDSTLLRGNRAKKVSIPAFKAFDSPNCLPLATVGATTTFGPSRISEGPYKADFRLETHIVSLPLFPGINMELFYDFSKKGVKGLILQAFGPGDIPMGSRSVVHLIRSMTEKGIPTIVCSQAVFGTVDLDLYATGRAARDAGAISAGDMTWEAVIGKTMTLLGRGLPLEPFRRQFLVDQAGELTTPHY